MRAVLPHLARGLEGSTYRGAFGALGRASAIDPALVAKLMGWASFRNVLAHFYPVVDLQRVHDSLREIDVLERFLELAGDDRGV